MRAIHPLQQNQSLNLNMLRFVRIVFNRSQKNRVSWSIRIIFIVPIFYRLWWPFENFYFWFFVISAGKCSWNKANVLLKCSERAQLYPKYSFRLIKFKLCNGWFSYLVFQMFSVCFGILFWFYFFNTFWFRLLLFLSNF